MSEEFSVDKFELDENLNLKSDFDSPSFHDWKVQVEKDLRGASYEKKLISKTYEQIKLNPIYTFHDIENSPFLTSLPGFDNMARGNYPGGYHKEKWDVNQEIITSDVEEFNSAILNALNNGQNCINLMLDSATKLGLDADYAETKYVGDIGLSISAINSMKRALDGVDLNLVPIYVDTGFNSLPFLALIAAHCEANGIDISKLHGAVTADPIAYLANYGEWPVSQNFIFNSIEKTLKWSINNAPCLRTISVSTLPFINAGANSAQELAYAMSVLVLYVNELLDRGIKPADVISNTQFTLGIGNNYFTEISKFRAARVLFSNLAEQYKIEEKELEFYIGAKSTKFTHSKIDPYVNMLRSTTQAFSAILGGVNSLTTLPFDESVRESDSFSRRIARNTQTVLREEAHLDTVIDPAGGSYFIENLTEELAKKAWEIFKEIESDGGILTGLSKGTIQKSINDIYLKRREDINKRKSVIVGTNMFADVKETKLKEKKLDQAAFKRKRAEYLKKFRLIGTKEKHESVIEKLNSISDSNSIDIFNTITKAYLLGTTLGEISSALYSANKENIKIEKLPQIRASEEFERLRESSLKFKQDYGFFPKVFVANFGTLGEFKPRADFSKGFFEVGGFDVIDSKGTKSVDDLIESFLSSEAKIIVICSSDNNYTDIVPPIVKGVKQKNPQIITVLAGYPKDQIEAHRNSGIDDFIYLGADVMEKLTNFLDVIGGDR